MARQAYGWLLTVILALGGAAGYSTARGSEDGQTLTAAEFQRLHRELQPPAAEGWRALPWETSLLAAQRRAAREKKPVYMLVRSGHPLGCV